MITEIGIIVGEIWHFLEKYKETTLSKILSKIDRPRDEILMSLGWLAREGHIILNKKDSDYKVSLRKNK